MNDFFTWRHRQFVHVFDDRININSADFIIRTGTSDHAAVLHTLDMLTCNTHVHITDLYTRFSLCFKHSFLNGYNGLLDVGYDSAHHTQRFRTTHPHNFHFPVFVSTSNDGGNFCGADIKSYNDVCIFHQNLFFCANNLIFVFQIDD